MKEKENHPPLLRGRVVKVFIVGARLSRPGQFLKTLVASIESGGDDGLAVVDDIEILQRDNLELDVFTILEDTGRFATQSVELIERDLTSVQEEAHRFVRTAGGEVDRPHASDSVG